MNKKITLRDILVWIIDNQDNMDAMDKINKATFLYTSNYEFYQFEKAEAKGAYSQRNKKNPCIFLYHHGINEPHPCCTREEFNAIDFKGIINEQNNR